METIEYAIKRELEKKYEQEVKELIKKVYQEVNGDERLIPANLGDELERLLKSKHNGASVDDWLIRIGLSYVDWELVGEDIYYRYEGEVI